MTMLKLESHLRPLALTGVLLLVATNACGDDDNDDTAGGRGGTSAGGAGGSLARGGNAGGGGKIASGGDAGGTQIGGAGTGGEAGASLGGSAGSVGVDAGAGGTDTGGSGGAAGTAGTPGFAGAGGSADDGIDRDAYRPVEIPSTATLVAGLTLPAGFSINVFATGLQRARMLASRDGRVYVTRPTQGDVMMLSDADANGVAEAPVVAISNLNYVHGIVFDATNVYLATVNVVYRATVNPDGRFGVPTPLVSGLPDGGQHPLRTLGIGPDSMLYISVGSTCDACAETNPESATILRTAMNGTGRAVFASGLRNTIGFGWHPTSDLLWGMDNGSDWRGDELPPEELNQVAQGKNYGWPYCFAKRSVDPITPPPQGTTKEAFCATTEPSTLENQAHGAPIGMAFYEGSNFPQEYANNAFVALHGSWNRLPPTGYKVVRVVFDTTGTPLRIEDFVTGFLISGGTQTFGRPAGVTVAPDGALLFTDDTNGVIYRVRYGT